MKGSGVLPLLLVWAAAAGAVQRDKGIPDATAHVGRLLRLQVPEDAFQGAVERFEVTEAGENSLPQWLQFDSDNRILEGVPSISDNGQTYIYIKAIDGDSSAKDIFSIEIQDESTSANNCPFGKEETLANIIFDATLSEIKLSDKIHIISDFSSHFNIPESRFKIIPLHKDESSFDPGAIRAGPGNALQRNHEGTEIQFRVGCDGEVSNEYETVISNVEKSAANGELSDLIGHLVVGWQVTSAAAPILQSRDKRNVAPFSCPGSTPVPRLHYTRWPSFTRRIIESETKEAAPEVRIIPTMSSPRYTDRTWDHKHRHHHGQDPLRREHIFPTSLIQASPTFHYSSFQTSRFEIGGTPFHTPMLYPERPTRVVMPTRIYDIDGTMSEIPDRSARPSEDLLSRWYVPSSDLATADIKPTRIHSAVEPTKIVSQTANFKPVVLTRTKKLSLVAGKAWNYTIPIITFTDIEDGNTRDLKLIFMTSERTSLPSTSWIQFDPEHQVIYALPLSDNIGKHEFVLEAMDTEGASTFDRIELNVWAHPQANNFTHSFEMIVRHNKYQFPIGIDWQIEIMNKLAVLFNDTSNSKLVVLGVTLEPVKIIWTNDTLPTDPCPLETIKHIYDVIATHDHHPTKEMKKVMSPDFRVQDIGVKYIGVCHGIVTTPQPPKNFPPILRNPIKRINVTVGDIIKYKIPDNTFYDFEDGSTRGLRLVLLTSDNVQPHRTYWLQFDSRNQEIYGLPSENDIGRHDLLLTAVDGDDHSITDSFIIHVSRLSRRKKPAVEFSIKIDYNFDDFDSDTSKKTLVASKIARLYGDPDPRYMMVTNISRGSVVYAWTNKTLGHDYCPTEKIEQLVKYIIDDDGSIASNLIHIMEPEFKVISADAIPTGMCLAGTMPTFVSITTTTPQPSLSPEDLEPTLKTSTDDDIYITTIVPAIVIAVMLVIAAIVAYFLYWKKRKGKMSLGDKDFIGSGVPVVFAGELEESKPDLGKTPAIMKNEKPPLSTDYLLNPFRRGTGSGMPTTSKTREESLLRERKDNSTLYKPPPPFASNRELKNTRPKSTQAYRHATYVPP